MKVELTKFRIKENKSERVDEWVEYMQDHMDDVLVTLEGEKCSLRLSSVRKREIMNTCIGTVCRMRPAKSWMKMIRQSMRHTSNSGKNASIRHSGLKI